MQTSVDEDLDRLIAKRADRRPDPDEQEQAERSGDKLLARAAYTAAHREVSQSRDVGSLLERALTERALSSVEQSAAFGT